MTLADLLRLPFRDREDRVASYLAAATTPDPTPVAARPASPGCCGTWHRTGRIHHIDCYARPREVDVERYHPIGAPCPPEVAWPVEVRVDRVVRATCAVDQHRHGGIRYGHPLAPGVDDRAFCATCLVRVVEPGAGTIPAPPVRDPLALWGVR